jgi:hypothetical protein
MDNKKPSFVYVVNSILRYLNLKRRLGDVKTLVETVDIFRGYFDSSGS